MGTANQESWNEDFGIDWAHTKRNADAWYYIAYRNIFDFAIHIQAQVCIYSKAWDSLEKNNNPILFEPFWGRLTIIIT